ncbi:MAG TPA: hypothetical protein VIH19_08475 [Candidatus Limnocylindria bacterium]
MARFLIIAALCAAAAACGGPGESPPTSNSASPLATSSVPATPNPGGSGVPVGNLGNVDAEQLRQALLGDPPYPAGWEAEVDRLVAEVAHALEAVRVPNVRGMSSAEAACGVWEPLVGNMLWATGALLERQVFIAHVATLARVAPDIIQPAAREALAISAAAAAEQLTPGGDPAVISRRPTEAVRAIGLWAVEHCALPVEAEEAPDTDGWTADDIAFSCDLDRRGLEQGQEEYRSGPGKGLYAEHPHVLEVSVDYFVYPAWHHIVAVDNQADPPRYRLAPIPGSFCDR